MKKQGADVIGAKAGAKPKKPYIQKDTIGSTQNAEIVYGIGDGENGGLINGLHSIILDGTRVIGSSGEVNFNEVKYEERFGLIDQPPLKLIEDTITERGLNLEVRDAAPVVASFNNKDVDKFVVRISVPSLMQNKDNGDSVAATISYAIDISVDGGAYQTVVEASATEKITNGYEFDHEIEAPEGTQRTIRVRRTMADSSSQLLINKFYVAAISEVINAKFSHPTLHHIGLVFNAEQFNNIPKVVFHYYGRKIKVPVNYNPTTRQYEGIWNGTFKVVYSNNPAWVLFDILTDRRSGLGRRIPVELVDKWELYRIAQYCDELVPDGDGGMEPRFVCNNLVLNSKQDAYQVLKDIASIFRGQSFWNGSQVVTVADAPRDIDYAISMASVISYSYSGTARNARHNVVKVQYYDKNNENSAAYEYATDYDSIRETEQINEVEIRAFGCTSAGQAQRLARYTLLSEQTETRILTAKLSMDAFVNMQLGDVFAWSDKFLAGANNGGRVVAVNGAELTLDRDVTDSALVGDTLLVNTTTGKASTRTITAINGNKVTLDAVMDTTEPEFVWVIDSADLSLLYFKLDDYKVNPAEGTVDIVGIQHVNGKFGTIDTETALEAPPFSKVEIETLRAPGNVITSFNVRVDQGINIADLYVSWGQVQGATRYTVEFRRDSQAWRVLGTVTGLTHTIENVSAGIYEVRVRAADSIGNLSPYGFSAPINVAGIVLPPPKLASFSAVGKLLAIETKWTFPAGTEASLAVVIEHTTQDPENVGVPTQKLNIPYPQTEYVFNGLGAHTQMWFRAAIVDKYNQEGEFTAWTTATADANPEELIDLISGHINEGTLDQILKGKIDGALGLADEANSLASQANATASNAQATATQASTKAQEAANAVVQEAIDRAAAIQDGITQVTTDYIAGDAVVLGEIVAYKTSNDSAMATVVQKAESAVAAGSTNSQAITELTGQVQAINDTKLDASVISNYYTRGQADDKSAEIAAGKIESYDATIQAELSANANAIQTVNAEVARVNGEVVSTVNSVNNLSSNVGLLQGSINEVRQTVTDNQESTNTLVTSLRSGMADADDVSMLMRNATVLYEDLNFRDGYNGVTLYNLQVNGALVCNFTDKLPDNPVASTRQLQFIHSGGATEPELGGFHQETWVRSNGVFLVKFVAKLPVGFSFGLFYNEYGDGATCYFIGGNEGTGKFKTYYGVYRCGATGSFSTIGFVFVDGPAFTPENPLIWYLASSTVYDCLDSKVAPDSVINGIAEAKSTASTAVNKSEATALLAQNLQTALDNTNADISNNYYTRSQADTATAGHISSYDANLVIGGVNTYDNETTPISGLVGNPEASYRNSVDTPNGFYLVGDSTGQSAIRLGGVITEAGWWTISFYIRGSQSAAVGFKIDIVDRAEYFVRTNSDNTWKYVQYSSYVDYVDSTHSFIDFSEIGWAYIYLKDIKVERGRKATAWTPSNQHVLGGLSANASAIQSTTAEVQRIDGMVTSQASQIVTLESSKSAIENGAIAGNDEFIVDLRDPAYNRDLYYPVLLSGFSTEYRQTIRVVATLNGLSVPPWASHGGGFSINAQFQMGGAGWGTIDPEIVTDNFIQFWTHGGISPLDEIGQIIASSQPFFYVRGGGYYRLSKPVNRSVQVCAPSGSLSGYHEGTLYPRPYQESTVPKSINQGVNQQNVKLQQTNTVLDGVKAVSTVTIDNNGVMSGYGLISELANGQVRSSFGVNADTFFIGSPSLDKKPFIQRNDWSVINGVWVPPGTYIDTAYIANATIGLAHINTASIGSLSALSANIGLFRTAEYGRRTEISDSGLRVYNDAGIAVVEIGDF